MDHARDFVSRCRERIQFLRDRLDREPVVVATFDTEHFGHWWHEGPQWLDLTIRMIAAEAPEIKLISAEDYLRLYPTNQEVIPSMSSWGWEGYGETWLMGRNDWIYRELFERFDDLRLFLSRCQPLSVAQRAAINQYLREFLLAQASDWAFMLHRQQNETFVKDKLHSYFADMKTLLSFAERDCVDSTVLSRMEAENAIFLDMDLLTTYLSFSAGLDRAQAAAC
jgi:1,4-alpha-glucan branching enzyme